MIKTGDIITLPSGLKLRLNHDGTFTDQYGRLLKQFIDDKGKQDFRPVGLDPNGATH